MTWAELPLGKHAGLTLPQMLFTNQGWFRFRRWGPCPQPGVYDGDLRSRAVPAWFQRAARQRLGVLRRICLTEDSRETLPWDSPCLTSPSAPDCSLRGEERNDPSARARGARRNGSQQ